MIFYWNNCLSWKIKIRIALKKRSYADCEYNTFDVSVYYIILRYVFFHL